MQVGTLGKRYTSIHHFDITVVNTSHDIYLYAEKGSKLAVDYGLMSFTCVSSSSIMTAPLGSVMAELNLLNMTGSLGTGTFCSVQCPL